MAMIAPTFEMNPRRLKQWLNLFRLRYFVASNTGQLGRGQSAGWSLPQLGKVVAIELRWPMLIDHLLDTPGE
jgi:hypothetical protein